MAFIPQYQARANGSEDVSYAHPDFEKVLGNTFGVLVYQEQLMRLSQVFGRFSAGDADGLRKATGKKSKEVMDKVLPDLHARILNSGYTESIADSIIKLVEPWVGYGFNRSHAASYAFIAYQTAFFKTYYPAEFFAALLTVFSDDQDKVIKYIANGSSMGINVLPPDINKSGTGFTIEGKDLRFGLASIKGLGSSVLDYIAEHRPFPNIAYIVENVPKKQMNKKAIEVLCLTGAFDNLDIMEIVEEKADAYPHITNRMHLFQHVLRMRGDKADLTEEIKAFDQKTLLTKELELLGLYISGHPLDDICAPLDWSSIANFDFFETAGVITSFKETVTKKGDKMAFVNIDTSTGKERIVLFPMQYERLEVKLQAGLIMKMKIQKKYDAARDEVSYIADRVQIPKRINKALLS
jgi:DNA polymerase-3 subunit alpha